MPTSTRASTSGRIWHPLLLVGHADADPNDGGAGGLDLRDDRVPLLIAEGAEWRGEAADDLDAGVPAAQVGARTGPGLSDILLIARALVERGKK